MKTKLFFLLFIFCNSFTSIDYINKYFPEDSVIRKTHNSEPHRTGWLGFDSNIRSACDSLNSIFSSLAQREYNDYSIWYLHAYDYLKEAIALITHNHDKKTLQIELDWALELKSHLDKKVEEKYEKSAEYQQKLEREQRLIAIRKALEQKDLQ